MLQYMKNTMRNMKKLLSVILLLVALMPLQVTAKEISVAYVDLQYILRRRRESFGWSLLTDQKRFYAENYPGLVIERVTLDEFIMMMLKGETL